MSLAKKFLIIPAFFVFFLVGITTCNKGRGHVQHMIQSRLKEIEFDQEAVGEDEQHEEAPPEQEVDAQREEVDPDSPRPDAVHSSVEMTVFLYKAQWPQTQWPQ